MVVGAATAIARHLRKHAAVTYKQKYQQQKTRKKCLAHASSMFVVIGSQADDRMNIVW
jgi:hypothetical protein